MFQFRVLLIGFRVWGFRVLQFRVLLMRGRGAPALNCSQRFTALQLPGLGGSYTRAPGFRVSGFWLRMFQGSGFKAKGLGKEEDFSFVHSCRLVWRAC